MGYQRVITGRREVGLGLGRALMGTTEARKIRVKAFWSDGKESAYAVMDDNLRALEREIKDELSLAQWCSRDCDYRFKGLTQCATYSLSPPPECKCTDPKKTIPWPGFSTYEPKSVDGKYSKVKPGDVFAAAGELFGFEATKSKLGIDFSDTKKYGNVKSSDFSTRQLGKSFTPCLTQIPYTERAAKLLEAKAKLELEAQQKAQQEEEAKLASEKIAQEAAMKALEKSANELIQEGSGGSDKTFWYVAAGVVGVFGLMFLVRR